MAGKKTHFVDSDILVIGGGFAAAARLMSPLLGQR